jgi:voltage-gated potassium channel Kch
MNFIRTRPYRGLTISVLVILMIGTIIYHFVEGWNWLDSLYFSVITLTTVGYGDFSPATDFGKVFTIIFVLTGIGIIFGFINTFYQRRISRIDRMKAKQKDKQSNQSD